VPTTTIAIPAQPEPALPRPPWGRLSDALDRDSYPSPSGGAMLVANGCPVQNLLTARSDRSAGARTGFGTHTGPCAK